MCMALNLGKFSLGLGPGLRSQEQRRLTASPIELAYEQKALNRPILAGLRQSAPKSSGLQLPMCSLLREANVQTTIATTKVQSWNQGRHAATNWGPSTEKDLGGAGAERHEREIGHRVVPNLRGRWFPVVSLSSKPPKREKEWPQEKCTQLAVHPSTYIGFHASQYPRWCTPNGSIQPYSIS